MMTDGPDLYEQIVAADADRQVAYTRYLCEQYLQQEPDHTPTLLRYANSLISLAQYDGAKAALDHADETISDNYRHLVAAYRGDLLKAQGKFLAAEEAYLEAHRLDPEDASYLIFAASAAFRRGNLDKAMEYAGQAGQCGEGAIDEAICNLGGYLLSVQRYEEAADCYRKALELDPNYHIARKRLEDVERVLARMADEQDAAGR